MTKKKQQADVDPKVEVVEETVEEETVEESTVVVHDYDPVRPHSRRKNETDDVPAWIGQEHPEVDE